MNRNDVVRRRVRTAPCAKRRACCVSALPTQKQGKPFAEARGEVLAGAEIIEWFADEGRRVYGRIVPSPGIPSIEFLNVSQKFHGHRYRDNSGYADFIHQNAGRGQ